MPDPSHRGLRAVIAGEAHTSCDPRQHRRFLIDKLGAPKDFAAQIVRETVKKGRPRITLSGAARDAWEEDLASTLTLLAVGGTMEVEATNDQMDRLAEAMERTAAIIRDVSLADGDLISLEMRLRLNARRVRAAPRQTPGKKVDQGNHLAGAALLRLYTTAFERAPSANPDGPAARFLHAAWSIVADAPRIAPARRQKIGTPAAAVKRAVRLIDSAKKPGKRPTSRRSERSRAPEIRERS